VRNASLAACASQCPIGTDCELPTANYILLRPFAAPFSLEGVTVGILAANSSPPYLESRYIDGDDEKFSQVVGRSLERTYPVPGMVRALEKQAAISPRVDFGADLQIIEGRGGMRFEASTIV